MQTRDAFLDNFMHEFVPVIRGPLILTINYFILTSLVYTYGQQGIAKSTFGTFYRLLFCLPSPCSLFQMDLPIKTNTQRDEDLKRDFASSIKSGRFEWNIRTVSFADSNLHSLLLPESWINIRKIQAWKACDISSGRIPVDINILSYVPFCLY